ncbi:hypothetical protein CAEBREN_08845 [Caenorhabditis brenneri]|uniref:Uncharacterized protein n=1 Tax=Caenorhabditis brenneri TaxID=135651 RepID=G0MQ04_CAEBE|nr:hypothetical protein CAEBREN_08845 [Caenorhabditis brenneri]
MPNLPLIVFYVPHSFFTSHPFPLLYEYDNTLWYGVASMAQSLLWRTNCYIKPVFDSH